MKTISYILFLFCSLPSFAQITQSKEDFVNMVDSTFAYSTNQQYYYLYPHNWPYTNKLMFNSSYLSFFKKPIGNEISRKTLKRMFRIAEIDTTIQNWDFKYLKHAIRTLKVGEQDLIDSISLSWPYANEKIEWNKDTSNKMFRVQYVLSKPYFDDKNEYAMIAISIFTGIIQNGCFRERGGIQHICFFKRSKNSWEKITCVHTADY